MKKALFFLSLFVAILGGCRGAGNSACGENRRSMYYWSTTFSLDSTKLAFIKQHDISRLYVRYFDVVMRDGEPMPNATIRFDSVAAAPCEIVPVVYIHNDCLKDVSPQQFYGESHRRAASLLAEASKSSRRQTCSLALFGLVEMAPDSWCDTKGYWDSAASKYVHVLTPRPDSEQFMRLLAFSIYMPYVGSLPPEVQRCDVLRQFRSHI